MSSMSTTYDLKPHEPPATPAKPRISSLTERLIDALNDSGVAYCHWKSNVSLDNALAGHEDLDLLVDRPALPRVLEVLASLNFKQAVVRRGDNPAGIAHYYGHDPELGVLRHVHLFSRVLTGESFVKGHWLPLDAMLLADPTNYEGLRMARPEAELVLMLARNFIKYGSLVDIPYLMRGRSQLRREVAWLRAAADLDETLALANHYLPTVPRSLWLACLDAVNEDASLPRRVRLAWRMRRALLCYRVRGEGSRLWKYGRLIAERSLRAIVGRKKNKRLLEGGAVIALVGPEATGKSTLVAECAKWLGKTFAVRTVHAGKPPSAWLTWPVNALLPWLRRYAPTLRTNHIDGHLESEGLSSPPNARTSEIRAKDMFYAIRSVALAWDRRRLLLRARRAAAAGEIVICDRFPSDVIGSMDSPRLEQPFTTGPGWKHRFLAMLARWEAGLYSQIPAPDGVIQLTVDLETAKSRNRERIKVGKESDSYVESRHRRAGHWRRAGARNIRVVDTSGSLDTTIAQMKDVVWTML
ncbi:MAG: hypothetical protein KDA42_03785 [Planctomycetales bacterium]|nr:hypothetical protein [Planctomycetales bacterium]